MTEERRSYFRERKKAWRTRHALEGLCSECSRPALPDRSHCAPHRECARAKSETARRRGAQVNSCA